MTEQTLQMEQVELMIAVFGAFDENIKLIERELGLTIVSRETELKVSGEPEAVAVDYVTCGSDEIEVQITVAEGDIGKVIGRQGRIIKAIRTLARAAASQCGLHAEVELAD